VNLTSDSRLTQCQQWIKAQFGLADLTLTVISGDASFRRYFRFSYQQKTFIAVDAPPDKEDSRPFVEMSLAYEQQGLKVPQVIKADFEQGFMCLTDLGDRLLLPELNAQSVDHFYQQALALLTPIAGITASQRGRLPLYDEAMLRREMAQFTEWFLPRHLNLDLTTAQQQIFAQTVDILSDNALAQPQVGVHRDYHSRNLMLMPDNALAVIDYQDAVIGGITYDAVSLLRDCYIRWPDELIYRHLLAFKAQMAQTVEALAGVSDETFIRWFDLMGMQRHIKVCGVFSRLFYRDGKAGYLDDIPLTLNYLIDVANKYPEFSAFAGLLETQVKPLLLSKIGK